MQSEAVSSVRDFTEIYDCREALRGAENDVGGVAAGADDEVINAVAVNIPSAGYRDACSVAARLALQLEPDAVFADFRDVDRSRKATC